MKIYGTFKNYNNDTIQVVIYNTYNTTDSDINIDTSDNIRFSDEPIIISTDLEDSFTHVIKTTCTISLTTKIWLGDYLYANNAESVIVNVFKDNTCIFCGFVTPNTFSQDFSHDWETLEINCIDYLSVLEYKYPTDDTEYNELKANVTNRSFSYLMNKMKLNNTRMIISNLPPSQNDSTWVTTGYEITAIGDIVGIESNVGLIDSYTAVKTGETRIGITLQKTWIQSEETCVGSDGKLYYKEYAWVTINGVLTKTSMWRQGQEAPMPTVDDTFNTLIGWTYGPLPNRFEYYEHFRIDYIMSDGTTKQGYNDTIGNIIPITPGKTTLGSYWEFREGDADDLDYDDTTGLYYYKDYAWIVMDFDQQGHIYKTGDWIRGRQAGFGSIEVVYNTSVTPNNIAYTVENDNTEYTITPSVYDVSFGVDTRYYIIYDGIPDNITSLNLGNNGNLTAFLASIRTITFRDVDTSLVTDMNYLFNQLTWCEKFDFGSSFDTSSVTHMKHMFRNCTRVKDLDISFFNTSLVDRMQEMFMGCQNLIILNLSNFDLSSAIYPSQVNQMFNGCNNLTTLLLDDVDNDTFELITCNDADLPTTCKIYRDGDVYEYDSNTNTWVIV